MRFSLFLSVMAVGLFALGSQSTARAQEPAAPEPASSAAAPPDPQDWDASSPLANDIHSYRANATGSSADHPFFHSLMLQPEPALPEGADSVAFRTGYREALTGNAILEILLDCEEKGALSCQPYRQAKKDEKPADQQLREKRLSDCKKGMIAGLAVLKKAITARSSPALCSKDCPFACQGNYNEAFRTGQFYCKSYKTQKPGKSKPKKGLLAMQCFDSDAASPGCRELGYLDARATCDTAIHKFMTVSGISDAQAARPLPAPPAVSGRAPASVPEPHAGVPE
jgi:hypothetical protein